MALLNTLRRVYVLGREMHPKLSINHLKHRVYMMFQALIYITEIDTWYETSDNPFLTLALQRFPLISGAMYWPYINYNWPLQFKLNTIDQHYRMLSGTANIIAEATLQEIELARLDDEFLGLRIVLDKATWFLREGEIVLNLFINDQRLYSIAFTLGIEMDQPVIYVGALQGLNSDTALNTYREITHALHGLRPRDLLMATLKMLCKELEVHKILAVSSVYRQHNGSYFGGAHRNRVLVPYDQVWQEHGGTLLNNGFYEMPVAFKKKDIEDVATRKRAVYRRRYLALDKLALIIKACVAQHDLTNKSSQKD